MKEGGGDGRRRGYFVLMLRLGENVHTAVAQNAHECLHTLRIAVRRYANGRVEILFQLRGKIVYL